MSHRILLRSITGIKFYRMGNVLIAPCGGFNFIAQKLTGGNWEASKRSASGLRMPVCGDVLPTLRDAISYLRPLYRESAT